MSQSAMDFTKLMKEPEKAENDTLWVVEFHAMMPASAIPDEALEACPDCGEQPDPEEIRAVIGELTVLAGSNAQRAIDQARDFTLSDGLEDFELRSVRFVGQADLIA